MKKYYVIEVYIYSDAVGKYKLEGYYTNIYKHNKGDFCGADSDVEYGRVTKYTDVKSAQRRAVQLDNHTWGNESAHIDYKFKVQEVTLDVKQEPDKEVIKRQNVTIAKNIIKDSVDSILDKLEDYVVVNDIDSENAKQIQDIIINKLSRII